MSKILATIWHVSGIAVILYGQYFANFTEDTFGVHYHIVHVPSIMVVFLGVLGLVIATTHYQDMWELIKSLLTNPPSKIRSETDYMESNLRAITTKYYESGTEGLRQGLDASKIPLAWKRIFEQIESKIEIADIRVLILRYENQIQFALNQQIKTLQMVAAAGPSMGLLGTVLGLIKLLAELQDFTKLAPNMALALLTTLYGIFCSIMASPMISHLENKQTLLIRSYEQVLFWIDMVQGKKPSFYLEQSYDQNTNQKG